MTKFVIARHGHCQFCDTDKTISVYRDEDGKLTSICGRCELKKEEKGRKR